MDSHDLALWVMKHCKPESAWRWKAPDGALDLVVVINSYRSAPGQPFPYDLEFDRFYLVGADDQLEQIWPASADFEPLPHWFVDRLRGASSFVPYHMNCDAFKRLVDDGLVASYG